MHNFDQNYPQKVETEKGIYVNITKLQLWKETSFGQYFFY